MKYSKITALSVMLIATMVAQAGEWTTYFAYNNVTQIAMSPDKVFAISDGNLFSVNKMTEEVEVYNRQSGLHATGITCIHYDELGEQLIICYATGKIDILSSNGVQYIGGLYDKDMTQRKTIYNVTISGRTAYLATHYGIQTMDLREYKMVDSYWLRPGGLETVVKDVLLTADSIYAFTDDSLFCASKTDNLVDYTYWKREIRTGRISPDTDKGVHYEDAHDQWYRGLSEGIVRYTATERLTYKPDGPIVNTPYRIKFSNGRLGVVPGGYDISRSGRPGMIMLKDENQWKNYDYDYIAAHMGVTDIRDFSDIIFDPSDNHHFFVASFGYGLIEFRADTFYTHYTSSNSAIQPVINNASYPYFWVDGLRYDSVGNLWMLNNSDNGVKVLMVDGTWASLSNVACMDLGRSQDLIISNHNQNIKIVSSIRDGIGIIDDNGTILDQSDDRAVRYLELIDEHDRVITIPRITNIYQLSTGALLIATQEGLFLIDDPAEMLNGNNHCTQIHLDLLSEGIMDIFNGVIRGIVEDEKHQVWIGTEESGLYCLTTDLSTVLSHYSIDNSPMPSNNIRSLCYVPALQQIWIGTAEGLILYKTSGSEEGLSHIPDAKTAEEDEGYMNQWRLHLSYMSPSEIAASPKHIYGAAGGALLSLDREDDILQYWNKSHGLTGNSVAHIAYSSEDNRLIITYQNGRIDLLSENGDVTQVPDLYMKAGSVSVTTNCIYVGSKYAYIGTNFGIIALNTRRGEIADSYYIGEEASSITIQQIVESRDSLYAFSYDRLYSASLQDNIADYTYWHSIPLPCEQVQQAAVWNNSMYTLQHDSLYRQNGTKWNLVRPESFQWMHVNDGQMLLYRQGFGVFRLTDDGEIQPLTTVPYPLLDGIYTNGEYWLAEQGWGFIRLGSTGDDYFHPEGPNSNFGYSMHAAHGQIYIAAGGRWAGPYLRPGRINIYNGTNWRSINESNIIQSLGIYPYDFSSIGVDPKDAGHFFAASYGGGIYEFRDYQPYKRYLRPMREKIPDIDPNYNTFVDGVTIDDQGNLWVLNATEIADPIHILSPNGIWSSLRLRSNGTNLSLVTPSGILIDRRDSHRKWFMCQRSEPGVILLDDGGTPTISSDDKCVKRSIFIDQNNNTLNPSTIRCLAQDKSNRIWIGTEKGILLIPANSDFLTSNSCRRIIVPRNDGTGLGDYLLGEEQINCIAVDGGNRMWIGTASSGVYVIEDDTITAAHFTENNSLLPSNSIQSIAINPTTGEVFVGTDNGLASYRADASEPEKTMSNVYAYPNPVRPDYSGYISITGLMENTAVNIVDAGGNLVCKTKSHGGTAVWDGKLPDGRRATPGVYTALCNANGGHTAVKILVIR